MLYCFLLADIAEEQMLPADDVASVEELMQHMAVGMVVDKLADRVLVVSLDLIVVLMVAFADIHHLHPRRSLRHLLLHLHHLVFSHSSVLEMGGKSGAE